MKILTCFIDTSAWIAIIDKNDPRHRQAREYFEQLLEKNTKLITNNIVIDRAAESLKSRLGAGQARQFTNIIDDSILTINLRLDWISRRIRKLGLNQFLKSNDSDLGLHHFYIQETLKRKHADVVFTFDTALKKFSLPLMPHDD